MRKAAIYKAETWKNI